MNSFNEIFKKRKIKPFSNSFTLEDTETRRRAINAKRTFDNLFNLGFIPVVNENDSIATSEIKYGDNDRLASRVAQISGSDCLILLSDVDGLFDKNPKLNQNAKIVSSKRNKYNVENYISKNVSEHETGGMKTKLRQQRFARYLDT